MHTYPASASVLLRMSKHSTLAQVLAQLDERLAALRLCDSYGCWMAYVGRDSWLGEPDYQRLQPLLGAPEQRLADRLAELPPPIYEPPPICQPLCQCHAAQRAAQAHAAAQAARLAKLDQLPITMFLCGVRRSVVHRQAFALARLLLAEPLQAYRRHSSGGGNDFSRRSVDNPLLFDELGLVDRSVLLALQQPASARASASASASASAQPVPILEALPKATQQSLLLHVVSQLLWRSSPGLGLANLCGARMIKTPDALRQFRELGRFARCCYEETLACLEALRDRLDAECCTRNLLRFAPLFGLALEEFFQAARRQIAPDCDLSIEQLLDKIEPARKSKSKASTKRRNRRRKAARAAAPSAAPNPAQPKPAAANPKPAADSSAARKPLPLAASAAPSLAQPLADPKHTAADQSAARKPLPLANPKHVPLEPSPSQPLDPKHVPLPTAPSPAQPLADPKRPAAPDQSAARKLWMSPSPLDTTEPLELSPSQTTHNPFDARAPNPSNPKRRRPAPPSLSVPLRLADDSAPLPDRSSAPRLTLPPDVYRALQAFARAQLEQRPRGQ